MIVKFWWGGSEEERCIYWRKWDYLCRPKYQGGMGFRDLGAFNQSLLAKQVWRQLYNQDSLVARIFKSKYFPSGDLLHANYTHNSSFVWRSLLWGRDLVAKGVRWRVGNGNSIKVFQDSWLLRPHSFRPITTHDVSHINLRVADFIGENGVWDWQKISISLWDVDVDEVKRIPMCDSTENDKLVWHYNPRGEYSVRSGYHLAMANDESGSDGLICGFSKGLKKLWGLRISNKIKIHVWRMIFDALPTCLNLVGRKVKLDTQCLRCSHFEESNAHLFWCCKYARKVWKQSGIWHILRGFPCGSIGDLFCWVVDQGTLMEFNLFVVICWSLWFSRNQLVFQGKSFSVAEVINKALQIRDLYSLSSNLVMGSVKEIVHSKHWSLPDSGVIKVNVDASIIPFKDHFAVGMVARDSSSSVLCVEGKYLLGIMTPLLAELMAIQHGISRAIAMGWKKIVIESDASNAIHAINNVPPLSMEAQVVNLICRLSTDFVGISFAYIPRSTNSLAHEAIRR